MKEQTFNSIVELIKQNIGCTKISRQVHISQTSVTNVISFIRMWGYEEAYNFFVKGIRSEFDEEFLKRIAELVIQNDFSIYETAIAFKINYSTLRRNVNKCKAQGGTFGLEPAPLPEGLYKEALSKEAINLRKNQTKFEKEQNKISDEKFNGFTAGSSEVPPVRVHSSEEIFFADVSLPDVLDDELSDEVVKQRLEDYVRATSEQSIEQWFQEIAAKVTLGDCVMSLHGERKGHYVHGNSYALDKSRKRLNKRERGELAKASSNLKHNIEKEQAQAFPEPNSLPKETKSLPKETNALTKEEFAKLQQEYAHLTKEFEDLSIRDEITGLESLDKRDISLEDILNQAYAIFESKSTGISADEYVKKYLSGTKKRTGPTPYVDVNSDGFDDLPDDIKKSSFNTYRMLRETQIIALKKLLAWWLD